MKRPERMVALKSVCVGVGNCEIFENFVAENNSFSGSAIKFFVTEVCLYLHSTGNV